MGFYCVSINIWINLLRKNCQHSTGCWGRLQSIFTWQKHYINDTKNCHTLLMKWKICRLWRPKEYIKSIIFCKSISKTDINTSTQLLFWYCVYLTFDKLHHGLHLLNQYSSPFSRCTSVAQQFSNCLLFSSSYSSCNGICLCVCMCVLWTTVTSITECLLVLPYTIHTK